MSMFTMEQETAWAQGLCMSIIFPVSNRAPANGVSAQ